MNELKAFEEVNRKNQIRIILNAGVLRSAVREIKTQASCHGDTVFTKMVLVALESALEKAGAA